MFGSINLICLYFIISWSDALLAPSRERSQISPAHFSGLFSTAAKSSADISNSQRIRTTLDEDDDDDDGDGDNTLYWEIGPTSMNPQPRPLPKALLRALQDNRYVPTNVLMAWAEEFI